MKILVFGANSLLGQDLVRVLDARGVDFDVLTSEDVDVLKPREVMSAVSRSNPTQLVNVATYSNLQKAESDPEEAKLCDLVNTEGVASLAKVSEQLHIPIIHHSSSYVFDGTKKDTYTEEDATNPVNQYGKSKWYGERTLRDESTQHIILRTDWLFSDSVQSYFRRVIDECKTNNGKVGIVDNRFSPTHTADAARVIYAIIMQIDCNAQTWGTYHYNALQPVNQDQFVQLMLEEAAKLDKDIDKLLPKLEFDLLPVELPYINNSALNCEKIMGTFGIKQRSRGQGVVEVLEQMYGVKKPLPSKKKSAVSKKTTTRKQKATRKKAQEADSKSKKQAPRAKSAKHSKQPARKAAKQK